MELKLREALSPLYTTYYNMHLLLVDRTDYIDAFAVLCKEFGFELMEVAKSIPCMAKLYYDHMSCAELLFVYFTLVDDFHDMRCIIALVRIHKKIMYGAIYKYLDEITTPEDIRSKCEHYFTEITGITNKKLHVIVARHASSSRSLMSTQKYSIYSAIYDMILISYLYPDMTMLDILKMCSPNYHRICCTYRTIFNGFGLHYDRYDVGIIVGSQEKYISYDKYYNDISFVPKPITYDSKNIIYDIRIHM